MATTVILFVAMTILLIFTTYKRLIYSPHKTIILIFHLLVVVVFLLYRTNTKHAKQAPLFSFPSLSQPLVSLPSISLSQPLFSFRSLSQPLLSIPSLSLKTRFDAPPPKKGFALPNPVVAAPTPPDPDVVILDKFSYQDLNINADVRVPDEEAGGMSMDDTWNAILASGGAKPVLKLKKSEIRQGGLETAIPKAKLKNSAVETKKKKKRAEKIEERVEGWRHIEALATRHDDLSRRVEAFIKKQKDCLKLQREESDHRRLLERVHMITRKTF